VTYRLHVDYLQLVIDVTVVFREPWLLCWNDTLWWTGSQHYGQNFV